MQRLHRLLRHLRSTKKQAQQVFSASAIEQVEHIIHASPLLNRFHVKLAIEVALPMHVVLRKKSARDRACALFARHHPMHDVDYRHTFIYINLADHRVEIINDPVTTQLLAGEQWDTVCKHITDGFIGGDPVRGITHALHTLSTMLESAAPATLRQKK